MIEVSKRSGILTRIRVACRVLIASDYVTYFKFGNNWNKAFTNSEFSIHATNHKTMLSDTIEIYETITEHRKAELFCEELKRMARQ